MSKRVYISADYSQNSGDRDVIDILNKWGSDRLHIVDFVDTAKVVSGSISDDPDCRICDLKEEFNRQINASSAVIFVIGDKTALRTAGCNCQRMQKAQYECYCTPYKQNTNGSKVCKVGNIVATGPNDDYGCINSNSYLRHEFEQAVKCKKTIIIFYNSLYLQKGWLPSYMKEYEDIAQPFWTKDNYGNKVGNYYVVKKGLGYV